MAGPSRANGQNGHASSEVGDGTTSDSPAVLQAINKRLRNARKRLRGIDEIQAKAATGKELNPDQVGASDPCLALGIGRRRRL